MKHTVVKLMGIAEGQCPRTRVGQMHWPDRPKLKTSKTKLFITSFL